MAKRTVIHVDQHAIRRNAKTGSADPVLSCKTYDANLKGRTAIIKDDAGNEIGRFVYSPDKPLACGAKVWFETRNQVEVLA
jgi:hypothetical protein